MSDVTRVLQAIDRGDPAAAAELLPLVYAELRRLAASKLSAERADHTLQPTALVHEAFLRLVGSPIHSFNGRGHFFAAAAEGMQRILVDHARSRNALKRGQGKKVEFDWSWVGTVVDLLPDERSNEMLALDEALSRLVLQLRIPFSRFVVTLSRDSLVSSTPGRPHQDSLVVVQPRPDDSNQESPDFGFRERNEVAALFE